MVVRPSLIKNHSGQVAVEYILVAFAVLTFGLVIARNIRSENMLAILNPWQNLQGMIESGVWERPDRAKALHPNLLDRSISFKGDPE